MSQPATAPAAPVKLNVRAAKLTDEQFTQLCRENPELRLELTAQKELVIMSLVVVGYHRKIDNPGMRGKLRSSRVATAKVCASAVAAISKSWAPTVTP